MTRRVALLCAVVVAQLAFLLSPATAAADSKYVHTFKSMGTNVSVTIWTDNHFRASLATSLVVLEFDRVNRAMSSWLPDSDVARINATAGSAQIPVSDEVYRLIEKAQAAARASGGAFDITVGAFRGLWKFDHDRDGTIPKPSDVKARLALVGHGRVNLSPEKKSVGLAAPNMRITLGGIAKGHAVDRAVALLRSMGMNDFIVQAGGDLFVSGDKDGKPWVVGIRDPRGPRDKPFALLPLKDRTFSTSGDYERFVIIDGKRYHHLLDPKTGMPATRSRSVTVLAKDATTADIWSTALFIIGAKRGMKLVESMDDIEAVFVDADNDVHVSKGLEGRLQVMHEPTPGL